MISRKFIQRKQCWIPTLYGWLIILVGFLVSMILFILSIHPFLAIDQPVQGDILVVEGWLPKNALKKAVEEFEMGEYHLLVTTGGPIPLDSYLTELFPGIKSYAEISASVLITMGIEKNKIITVSSPLVERNRTYSTAIALRNWLLNNMQSSEISINIFSLGPHARRTRLLFDMALGDIVNIGIIATDNINYNANRWWKSSTGVRTIIGELISYIYVKIFFNPKI